MPSTFAPSIPATRSRSPQPATQFLPLRSATWAIATPGRPNRTVTRLPGGTSEPAPGNCSTATPLPTSAGTRPSALALFGDRAHGLPRQTSARQCHPRTRKRDRLRCGCVPFADRVAPYEPALKRALTASAARCRVAQRAMHSRCFEFFAVSTSEGVGISCGTAR